MYEIAKKILETAYTLLETCEGFGAEDSAATRTKLDSLKKQLADEMMRRKTGQEAGQFMENFVNVMSNRKENAEFVNYIVHRTHRTLNQGLIGLFVEVMKEQALTYEKGRFDARNEASGKLCSEIRPTLDNAYFPFI